MAKCTTTTAADFIHFSFAIPTGLSRRHLVSLFSSFQIIIVDVRWTQDWRFLEYIGNKYYFKSSPIFLVTLGTVEKTGQTGEHTFWAT